MSEETDWTGHVANGQTWLRLLLMLLFVPLLGCAGFLILAVALFQFFSVLASGESNPQLRELGRDLSRFGASIVDFLTYNTERKPFSPAANASREAAAQAAAAPRTPGVTAKKTATRRTDTIRRETGARRRSAASSVKDAAPQEAESPPGAAAGNGEQGQPNTGAGK